MLNVMLLHKEDGKFEAWFFRWKMMLFSELNRQYLEKKNTSAPNSSQT